MTREEMREKVARTLAETQGEIVNDAWRFYLDDADAAIAIIRGETLEEAARAIRNAAKSSPYAKGRTLHFTLGLSDGYEAAAQVVENLAAIRALKD